MKMIFLILLFLPAAATAGDPHHEPETVINNYSVINKYIDSTGKAALFAADQIHHSENISGLQIGAGASEVNGRVGIAAGAAITIPGYGMFNGLISKEGDEIYRGIGYNKNFKP